MKHRADQLDLLGSARNTGNVVTLSQLRTAELRPAALILSRAMRDSPMHLRVFASADAERRRRALERFFRPVLIGLHHRGIINGVLGVPNWFMSRPGASRSADVGAPMH